MDEINKDLETITKQYYNEIYKYCRRRVRNDDIAYDITQDIFLALSKDFPFIDKLCVQSWLYKTAANKIADYYREVYKEKKYMIDVPIQDVDAEKNGLIYDPLEEMSQEEIDSTVQDIINGLAFEDRELYIDRYLKKMDYTRLAQKYNVSEQSMRKRVSRLREKLNKIIKEIFK